jgi:hypothetical protein
MHRELGLWGRHFVLLRPILPDSTGLTTCTHLAGLGSQVDRWFSPMTACLDATHYRLATWALVAEARARGKPFPFPEHLPANDFTRVAAWIAKKKDEGQRCAVLSYASPAARVGTAAAAHGFDISGTTFLVGGETLTAAKRAAIEATGAEVFPRYAITEIGMIGGACREMNAGDCVHVFSDGVAVITRRRVAPLSTVEVNSLLFTTLLPYAPHVFLNVEMDDAGVVEPAACGCGFRRLGFAQQIRDISSYGKLTGHGVTLVGTEVVEILEHALPARFGGGPADYQLVEQEGNGQSRLTLRVARAVPLGSTAQVRDFFLARIRPLSGGEIASRLWRDAAALEVLHKDPILTARGKLLPLHLLGGGAGTRERA